MEVTKELLEAQIKSFEDAVLRYEGAIKFCKVLLEHLDSPKENLTPA